MYVCFLSKSFNEGGCKIIKWGDGDMGRLAISFG